MKSRILDGSWTRKRMRKLERHGYCWEGMGRGWDEYVDKQQIGLLILQLGSEELPITFAALELISAQSWQTWTVKPGAVRPHTTCPATTWSKSKYLEGLFSVVRGSFGGGGGIVKKKRPRALSAVTMS